jgi:hypothetical protein
MDSWRIFHSHAWSDKAAVLPIKAALDAAGIPGWIDQQQVGGGDTLFSEIADGIDRAEVVLLYLSPAFVSRENCRKEVSLAVDYGKRLLPILLPGTPWPLRPSHGTHAGEIAGHVTGKLYMSAAGASCGAGAILAALERMGVSGRAGVAGSLGVAGGGGGSAVCPATGGAGAGGAAFSPGATLPLTTFTLPAEGMSAAHVVELMRTGAGSARVAEAGGRVLRDISCTITGWASCEASGAVPAVVAALNAHAGVAAAAEQCCCALGYISLRAPGQDACVSSGAVPAVLAALKAHAGVAAVAEQGSWALLKIAWTNPSHRAAIVAAGAIPHLAAAHTAHSGRARQKAHEALDKLGYTDSGQQKP